MKFNNTAFFLLTGLSLFSISANSMAQSDNAGNYSGGWTNGANGGTGFGAWAITSTNGTNFYSGNLLQNPTNAGINSFGSNAFCLYANPSGTPAFVQADRSFPALTNGKTFSLKWAINFDSGAGGNKGFNLYTGGTNKIQILNVNNGGSEAITLDGVNVGFGYGTTPMTWTFSQISSNTIRVAANDRDGSGNFAANVTVNGPADSFRIYASAMQAGDSAQPYFNDFAISNTPAGLDTNPPTIALANGVNKVTWVATNGTVNLSTNDVVATDAEGSVVVSLSQSNVVTTNNSSTIVIYTATDAAGYRSSITRVIAVGNDGNQWFYSTYPLARTVSTVGSTTIGGELWVDGATPGAGGATGVQAWVGVNSGNTDPATWNELAWTPAPYASEAFNNDRYEAQISGSNRPVGTYYYATRFRLGTNGGNTNFFYGGIDSNGQGGRWGTTRTNTNNVVFTNGNGILTVEQGRLVSFAVDMGVQAQQSRFALGTNKVFLMGQVTDWDAGVEMTRDGSTSVYRVTVPVGGATNTTKLYKFRSDHPQGGFEDDVNPDANETARVLTLGATDTNLTTAFFNNQQGFRNVTFSVDMNVQGFKQKFNPTSQGVEVRGSFNNFSGGSVLSDADQDGIYTGTFGVVGTVGQVLQHKFVITGTNNFEDWEDDFSATISKNRETALLADNTPMPLAKVWFDDITESRKLSFSVDMSGQVTKGNFTPGVHTAAVRTSLDNFAGSLLMNRVGSSSVYSLDYYVDGPLSAVPASLEYKFFNSANNAPNGGFEGDQPGGLNRILLKSDINAANLSTTTIAQATFVDATPPGATFAGWSGGATLNSANVGKYAIGAASNVTAASEVPVTLVDSNKLSLSAIVRTNDAKLKVEGEAGGSLTNWSTNGVSVTASTNTNGVPEGHQRQVFSVDRANSPTRQFLRLKATLQP